MRIFCLFISLLLTTAAMTQEGSFLILKTGEKVMFLKMEITPRGNYLIHTTGGEKIEVGFSEASIQVVGKKQDISMSQREDYYNSQSYTPQRAQPKPTWTTNYPQSGTSKCSTPASRVPT